MEKLNASLTASAADIQSAMARAHSTTNERIAALDARFMAANPGLAAALGGGHLENIIDASARGAIEGGADPLEVAEGIVASGVALLSLYAPRDDVAAVLRAFADAMADGA